MMSRAELEARLVDREGVGPLGTLEGLEDDLVAIVDALGEEGASVLADVSADYTASKIYDVAVLHEVLQAYASRYPKALYEAAAARLTAHGPATLVIAVGLTRQPAGIDCLRARVDTPDNATLVAIADAAAEIGTASGRAWLHELQLRHRDNVEVTAALSLALEQIGPGKFRRE